MRYSPGCVEKRCSANFRLTAFFQEPAYLLVHLGSFPGRLARLEGFSYLGPGSLTLDGRDAHPESAGGLLALGCPALWRPLSSDEGLLSTLSSAHDPMRPILIATRFRETVWKLRPDMMMAYALRHGEHQIPHGSVRRRMALHPPASSRTRAARTPQATRLEGDPRRRLLRPKVRLSLAAFVPRLPSLAFRLRLVQEVAHRRDMGELERRAARASTVPSWQGMIVHGEPPRNEPNTRGTRGVSRGHQPSPRSIHHYWPR
jgi:hypothetical protein